MTERFTDALLSEARLALEPSDADRKRMRRKVMTAFGAAGAATAVTTVATKTLLGLSGGTSSVATAVIKLSPAGVFLVGLGGVAVLVATENDEITDHTKIESAVHEGYLARGARAHQVSIKCPFAGPVRKSGSAAAKVRFQVSERNDA